MNKDTLNRQVKEDRALLLLTGIISFPVGFALYFYFKDKKGKDDYAKFARMSGYLGVFLLVFLIASFLIVYMSYLFNSCF